MSKHDLNDRQRKILKVVIDKHAIENKTISSLSLAKTSEFSEWSSATIRNDMAVLEECGYLKKEYYSSGKIPTQRGYQLYIESLMDEYPGHQEIKNKLLNKFSSRNTTIDEILDECAVIISNFLNLPILLTKNIGEERLRKIDLVNINEKYRLILLITSSGEIIKDFVCLEEVSEQKEQDLLAAIRLLNEQLYNCPVSQISQKLDEAKEQIKRVVYSFEFIYEVIISRILLNKLNSIQEKVSSKVYNVKAIAEYENINAPAILDLLDKYSTFAPINYNCLKTGKTLFNLRGESDEGFAIAVTDMGIHKLFVFGPLRMNYSLIKYLFDFLNEKIQILQKI
ncbi:heat-inducible transcription repressor HrcA [Candidatus Mycoplasma haematohominis]|uniref:Heat-inducible transcription repressor HrcA n=1 Tax=Candidatus Mycoplasma haematohominis TaxID=1494318 RepID=A0A478FPQ7_9MOLU|nr:heat-inducible transcription repressor HrcA [Candidatus Mycoplasma haemohominis]